MKKSILAILFTFFALAANGQGFDLPGSFGIDIGFQSLNNAPSELDTDLFKSRGISLYYKYEIPLGGNPKFTFNPGLGVTWEGYVPKDHQYFSPVAGQLYLTPAENSLNARSVDKTKLSTTSIDIPIEFQFRTNPSRKAFRISLGGKIGYLLTNSMKYKFEDIYGNDRITKEKTDFGLTKFRYGLTGRIGYGPVNLFAYMALNNFFDLPVNTFFEGDIIQTLQRAEDTKTFTVGITISAL